jgi:hypothetical protein
MDRLDSVVGPLGWADTYVVLPCGSVVCKLTLTLDEDAYFTKEDVGSPSDQPDAGDQLKAAFSDALKRAAVKWGVGRYLYSLPKQWCDYDPQKKRLTSTPTLPKWALPAKGKLENSSPVSPPTTNGNGEPPKRDQTALVGQFAHGEALRRDQPQSGAELSAWLDDLDAWAAERGIAAKGHVRGESIRLSGETKPIEKWSLVTIAGVTMIARGLVVRLQAAAVQRAGLGRTPA